MAASRPPLLPQDVYDAAGLMEGGRMLVHPICLPPFGPVDWEMTGSASHFHLLLSLLLTFFLLLIS